LILSRFELVSDELVVHNKYLFPNSFGNFQIVNYILYVIVVLDFEFAFSLTPTFVWNRCYCSLCLSYHSNKSTLPLQQEQLASVLPIYYKSVYVSFVTLVHEDR